MRGGELNPWWRLGLPVVAVVQWLLFRVRVTGAEHVPSGGPAILAFNHVSPFDGPVLAIVVGRRLQRETRFLVAAEFFRKPFFGWVLGKYDQISIRRGEGDGSALDEAIETVRRGALAAIAPEGAVNPHPDEQMRIRSGVARIALPTGAPIIPVGLWGTQRRMGRHGFVLSRPLRPRVGIAFGSPILPVGDVDDEDAVADLLERVGHRLEAQTAEARRLAGRAP